MRTYDTMSEAVNDLQKRGYDHDFNLEQEWVECKQNKCRLRADEFEIDEVYRFEGETDPGDENIVYAISSKKEDLKGVLVNGYGVYSDSISADLVSKLSKHKM
ncbi:MAG: phosphoribosylpyrophosphate synthetase [Bacteroidia bacterium]